MTRVNCGIPPAELTDRHLLAEHREIKRIPNAIKNGRARLDDIPSEFTLGYGHVKFFYDKIKYLYIRYCDIYEECTRRRFNVTRFDSAFLDVPSELWNDYEPTDRDRALIRERIAERLGDKK